MALYRETVIAGSSYRRAARVIMDNELNKMPRILYIEEDVLTLGNTVTTRAVLTPLGGAVDPSGVIELRDQTTKERTGQFVSAAMVYAALYSDYINRAEARDAADAAAAQALLAQSLTVEPVSAGVAVPEPTVEQTELG